MDTQPGCVCLSSSRRRAHPDANGYAFAKCDANADAYGHANSDSYTNCNGYSNGNGYSYPYA